MKKIYREGQYNLKISYMQWYASKTPKNKAYILQLVLEIQAQRETCVHKFDAALRELTFCNEATLHITLGSHLNPATFWAHCPHQAGRLDAFIKNERISVLGKVPAAETLILTKWKQLMK